MTKAKKTVEEVLGVTHIMVDRDATDLREKINESLPPLSMNEAVELTLQVIKDKKDHPREEDPKIVEERHSHKVIFDHSYDYELLIIKLAEINARVTQVIDHNTFMIYEEPNSANLSRLMTIKGLSPYDARDTEQEQMANFVKITKEGLGEDGSMAAIVAKGAFFKNKESLQFFIDSADKLDTRLEEDIKKIPLTEDDERRLEMKRYLKETNEYTKEVIQKLLDSLYPEEKTTELNVENGILTPDIIKALETPWAGTPAAIQAAKENQTQPFRAGEFFFAVNDLVENNAMVRSKVFKTADEAVKEFSILREYGHKIILTDVCDNIEGEGVKATFTVLRI